MKPPPSVERLNHGIGQAVCVHIATKAGQQVGQQLPTPGEVVQGLAAIACPDAAHGLAGILEVSAQGAGPQIGASAIQLPRLGLVSRYGPRVVLIHHQGGGHGQESRLARWVTRRSSLVLTKWPASSAS